MRYEIALVALAACTPQGEDDLNVAGPDDSAVLEETGDTGVEYVGVLSGSHRLWGTNASLSGSDICWHSEGFDLCTTTDEYATFRLEGLPVGVPGGLAFDHPDAWPTTAAFVLGEEEVQLDLGVDSAEMIERLHQSAGVDLDPALGVVCTQVHGRSGRPLEGATLALDPPGGVGPFFLNRFSGFDLQATTTTSTGIGYFLGVPPGLTAVVATAEGMICDEARWGAAVPPWYVEAGRELNFFPKCRDAD